MITDQILKSIDNINEVSEASSYAVLESMCTLIEKELAFEEFCSPEFFQEGEVLDNVKKRQVAALTYKYLFSISTFNSNDSITELCILNGQSNNQEDAITNIYDFAFQGNAIMPFAEILTLTENKESNSDLHFSLLNNLLGKHLI